MKDKSSRKFTQAISFIVVFILLASLAMCMQSRLFGVSLSSGQTSGQNHHTSQTVINTTPLSKNIVGFAGPTPVNIYVNSQNKIDSIVPLPNSETPEFFRKLHDEGLLSAWDNKSLSEAARLKVDAVSGATLSSNAIIQNVRLGIANRLSEKPAQDSKTPYKSIAALTVALAAAIIPIFIRNKTYRIIQQILNVAVLGFLTGTFLCYALIIREFANGLTFNIAGIISILLLVIGFIFPLFGKHNHYCNHVCPLGSAQELMGHLSHSKIKISHPLTKILNITRIILWAILTLLLWFDTATQWIDHELFSAFIVSSASYTMITIGILILIISIFTPRPFCRFICPTGSLLKQSEQLGI
ncbi:MAG: 4Fe-4S binding protein [Muribaculum sp.]|nr:4Fe-4S binding protein [Muribaculum sp.]